MRRVRRVSHLPNRAFDKSRLHRPGFRSDEFNTASVTSRRTPRRCSPVARVRRRSCSHQPETPDAVSSADLAFDQPLKGVPRSPGKTSASFARAGGWMYGGKGGRSDQATPRSRARSNGHAVR